MKTSFSRKFLAIIGRITFGCGWLLVSAPAVAQITPDNTLGTEQSQVISGTNSNQRIAGGAVRGHNLFHSFEDFNVNNNQSVYFANPGAILTIFSRVTGDNFSAIDGTLGVEGSADLFLLNPNGIMFGPNGRLDIEGSFIGSTAESLTFGDGLEFSAIDPAMPSSLLSISVVPGLQYGSQSKDITTEKLTSLDVGGNLTLGAQSLDLSGSIAAERDVILQGEERQLSNATYVTGGYFFTQDLNDNVVDFLVPHEQLITANGDLQLDEIYTGGSLHILAGGQVQVNPDRFEPKSATNYHLVNIFNGLLRPIIIAEEIDDGIGGRQTVIVRAHGTPTVDIRSGVDWQQLGGNPGNTSRGNNTPLTWGNAGDENAITGQDIFLHDIDNRSGNVYLNAPGNITLRNTQVIGSQADLNVDNRFSLTGGNITLISGDDITASALDASSVVRSQIDSPFFANSQNVFSLDGGNISLLAGGAIDVELLNTSSDSFTDANASVAALAGNAFSSDGGDITLQAGDTVNIQAYIHSFSDASSAADALMVTDTPLGLGSGNATSSQGGQVVISAEGDITVPAIRSHSSASSFSTAMPSQGSLAGDIDSGNAGHISLTSGGDITINDIDASNSGSSTPELSPNILTGKVEGGNGGNVSLEARGNIELQSVDTGSSSRSEERPRDASTFGFIPDFFESDTVTGGNGGDISITTQQGDISFLSLSAGSDAFSETENVTGGHGGDINLKSGQDILYTGGISSGTDVESNTGNSIKGAPGGDITINADGNIRFSGNPNAGFIDASSTVFSFEETGTVYGDDSGDIYLNAGGDIDVESLFLYSLLRSHSGDVRTGNAGNTTLLAPQGNIFVKNIFSLAGAEPIGGRSGFAGSMVVGDGGEIILLAHDQIHVADLISASLLGITPNPNLIETISGNGGNISLTTVNTIQNHSSVDRGRLISVAVNEASEQVGDGGEITLETSNVENLQVLSFSSSTQSGNQNIRATDDVRATGSLSLVNTEIIASKDQTIFVPILGSFTLDLSGKGQSGDINIENRNPFDGGIDIINSTFESDTSGEDNAGNVDIFGLGQITFNDSSIKSDTTASGEAGSIRIESQEGVRLTGIGSQISAQTSDQGIAGDIDFIAPDVTIENSAEVSTSTNGEGIAGDINLNVDTLSLSNGGKILARTLGAGNSGTITVNASESVELGEGVQNFEPVISVETNNAGRAGNIEINTPSFTLSKTARITATATANATNPDGGGSISLNANQMNLAGTVGIFAETNGQAPGGVLTLQPYQDNPNLDIALAPGARISASTSSSGQGGNLDVTAPDSLNIHGRGILAVETTGSGRAGNIDIAAQQVELADGVTISASTKGPGEAGQVTISGNTVSINNQARVETNTNRNQSAGDIRVNVANTLTIDNGTIESTTEETSTGAAGDITIHSDETIVRNNGQIAVNSEGTGPGGNITVEAERLTLRNVGQVTAATQNSNGGNIVLELDDYLLMRHNSSITASAGEADAGGDGGNVTITVPDGFIVAVPRENSDITANAFFGNGGRVNVTALNILGTEFRDALTPESDITASSRFGSDGTVTLNTPNLDPSRGLTELPVNLADQSGLIAERCLADSGQGQNAFVVTGRGGVPPSPLEVTQGETSGLVDLDAYETEPIHRASTAANLESSPVSQPTNQLVEAQTWTINENGDLEFVAQAPGATVEASHGDSCSGD